MEMELIPHYRGFLLMVLPPGGFLALGFVLVGKRLIDRRLASRPSLVSAPATDGAMA